MHIYQTQARYPVGPLCDDGQLQLVGGSTEYEGRVVCYNKEWATICDDIFDKFDATVGVCMSISTFTGTY